MKQNRWATTYFIDSRNSIHIIYLYLKYTNVVELGNSSVPLTLPQSISGSRSLILYEGMKSYRWHGMSRMSKTWMERASWAVCASGLPQAFINSHSIHVVWYCYASALLCMQGSPETEVVSMPCVTGPGGGRTVLSAEAWSFVIL